MEIFNQFNQIISEFDKAFEEFKQSYKTTMDAMQDCRRSITENHMVSLPVFSPEVVNEIETQIDDILYLVNYRGVVTDPTFEIEKYYIEILSIGQCQVADVDGEYIPLEKIDKEIYDQLLQKADEHYFNNHLHDDCMDFDDSPCAYDSSLI